MRGNTDNTVLDGRYRLLRRLGSGGMATVWAAHDERLGREVAVKLLSDVLAEDDRYRRRFEREARVAARMSHPGLVGVLDFGIGSERPYLVMELVRGETLAARIATGGLGLDVLGLAVELLDALAYMHRMHVVHRDVKPSNVLIGDDGRARLTDFGIARPENATELTETGQLLGTLAYMAPELRRGEPATPRSDLYSLGILLRECGGGRNPALAALIPRLTASESSRRPDSAEDARAVLTQTTPTLRDPATETSATAPTAVLTGAREAPRRWVDPRRRGGALALLATVATAIAVVVAIALSDGSGGQGSNSPPAATEPRTSTGGAEAEPAPTPAQDEGRAENALPVSCSALEKKKTALEEEKKGAEESAGDDREAKEAIKARFEARKKALEERAKECE